MLNKIIYILFVLSININIAQDCKTIVNIKVMNNDNALIFINDSYIENGSTEQNLSKGEYVVRVKEPGMKWNAKTIVDTINITNCENINLSYNFEEDVLLKSDPSDTYVYTDEYYLGNTPLLIPKSFEEITLEKFDYRSKNISLNNLNKMNPIKLDYLGELQKERFVDSPWFKVMIGTAVALGATAAYYKIQADNKFEEYEETKKQSLLDDTKSYDDISGVAFGVLQVNFAALIYLLLTH